MLVDGGLLSSVPRSGHPRESQIGEEFMMPRPTQANETERLPKNFPALQERMDIVKRSNAEKQQLSPRSPLENPPVVDKDDTFFLL